jgi:uncharacterized membrane protein YgaE (UPF0421/DUF939 family)
MIFDKPIVLRSVHRVRDEIWPVLQKTTAATAAWIIASYLVDHHEPFFAPIAAVVALNAPRGERGLTAVRLVQGVFVGIVSGELALAGLGGGYGTLALATFAAMIFALALGGSGITVVQAAIGAILTIASADGEVGPNRLIDALIGAGVALVWTQVLFSPEPVALLRRAEAAALSDMADGLDLTADALERDDAELVERAMDKLRDLRDQLAKLAKTRKTSRSTARHSLVWRSQVAPVAREIESAGHLDLLGGSCLMLTRTAVAASAPERLTLAPNVRELARALADLARGPGDRAMRQRAADRALQVARKHAGSSTSLDSTVAAALVALRIVAEDIMIFAGIDAKQAADAMRHGKGEFEIPAPPATPRTPFRWRRN